MNKNPLADLTKAGQSFWYDNIHRDLMNSGELQTMIDQDYLRGITSNPSIFEKAITSSDQYDESLSKLLQTQPQLDARGYFFSIAIDDIQAAADQLLPVYQATSGLDGYVSLEVSPDLAHDTEASVKEAKELWQRLDRPNVMIKIPSTQAGVPAVEQLIAEGININATLLFSVERYMEIAQAYINGLETRQEKGLSIDSISSVASFFISRVDSKIDDQLSKAMASAHANEQNQVTALMGKIAIANAKRSYVQYLDIFGDKFSALQSARAKPQRLLWASTGTKNADYSDILYIETLIGENTVNTMPPATYKAFRAHGTVANTLITDQQAAEEAYWAASKWVDMPTLMRELEDEGVATFAKSFDNLLSAIEDKIAALKQKLPSSAA